MKLWITGSQGLVGAALIRYCMQEGIDHVATNRSLVDVSSMQQIKKFIHSPEGAGVTHIINCAAYTNVDQAEKESDQAHLINAMGPENLGHVAHRNNLKIVHLSTDYVFGLNGEKPFTEKDRCSPVSIYAQTKYEGENRLLDAYPQACILRTSWVFGQGGKNFVSFLLDKIQKEEKIYVVHDQRNRATYVQDLCAALLAIICHSGIFHFANHGETSRFEIAQKMVEIAAAQGMPIACKEVVSVNSSSFFQAAKRPIYSALDTEKIEAILGIKPRLWESALKDFLCLKKY